MPTQPKILVICDYYLPGFESGGAARTLANMVERLGDRFDFRLITRDHDGTAIRRSYTTVKIGDWNDVGKAKVFYLSKDQVNSRSILRLIKEVSPDAIYLNSFFSRLTIFCLALVKLRRFRPTPIIIAPEGEFSPGALAINSLKKKLYIPSARTLLISKQITWKAAADTEKSDIERILGNGLDIHVAPNMPPVTIFPEYDPTEKPTKIAGKSRMIFLSRFMRKKNLNWLLEKLSSIRGDLAIDIYGTLEEKDYWEECQKIKAKLPSNIQIESKGPVSHDRVSATLFPYDFFVLPTLGENFGHVFIEALSSACPIVISDRTPWTDLQKKGIGWDLSLEDPTSWVETVQKCVDIENGEYQAMSVTARKFAVDWLSNSEIEQSNIEMLNAALAENRLGFSN